MEFLGDSVLDLITAEYFYICFPQQDEGFLTQMMAKVVNRDFLNGLGNTLKLGKFLRQYTPYYNTHTVTPMLLGNAFEALVGAVFIDRGYADAVKFFKRTVLPQMNLESLEQTDNNYKSRLVEWTQKEGKTLSFVLVDTFKEDNITHFTVQVEVDGNPQGTGTSTRKKKAEQEASRVALERLEL